MLSPGMYCFENRVDPDQLASKRPADHDQLAVFQSACKYILVVGILQIV